MASNSRVGSSPTGGTNKLSIMGKKKVAAGITCKTLAAVIDALNEENISKEDIIKIEKYDNYYWILYYK